MWILFRWIPFAVVITAFCGLIYLAVQQDIRHSANDPQIQMAEDAAVSLSSGEALKDISSNKVAIARSLAPFMIVYDASGNPLTSSGMLNGQTPELPKGVFDYVRERGEDRVTWQPSTTVRIAAVIVSYQTNKTTGFVLVGRSLREVEEREDLLLLQVGGAFIVTLVASFLTLALFGKWEKKRYYK